ncbi:RE1-silencing transcription factor A-like isoform X2, partial [Clarias magur]
MTDCMCRGCYATTGASLHYIPKDPEIRQKWIDFIYENRPAPKLLKNLDRIRICSAHFTEECFTNYRQKMMGFGKRLILKPNAVPTVSVQVELATPIRFQQEHVEEITAETRLCPLCQRQQKDSGALSLHLTKKHSVHPACLDNLLINAPYANPSFGPGQSISLVPVRESSVQNI